MNQKARVVNIQQSAAQKECEDITEFALIWNTIKEVTF